MSAQENSIGDDWSYVSLTSSHNFVLFISIYFFVSSPFPHKYSLSVLMLYVMIFEELMHVFDVLVVWMLFNLDSWTEMTN